MNSTAAKAHAGLIVGLLMVIVGMSGYVSYENRVVFDRWSMEFAAVLMGSVVLWAIMVALFFRRLRGGVDPRWMSNITGSPVLAVAVAVWAAGSLVQARSSPSSAARILDANLFGSIHPFASITDFVALAFFSALILGYLWRKTAGTREGVVLAIITTCATLLALEGASRAKAQLFPSTSGYPTYSGQLWFDKHVVLNSLGFRDPEPTEPPREASRLLLIGDSFAFGAGIERLEDRLDAYLAAGLTLETETTWHTRNGSRGDTHTLQHIAFLEQLLDYNPDLVVLEYVFNDMDYLIPSYERVGPVESLTGIMARINPLRLAYLNSYLFQEVYVRVRQIRARFSPPEDHVYPYSDPNLLAEHLEDLTRFVHLASESGAAVRIVPFDVGLMSPGMSQERYEAFVHAAADAQLPLCELAGAFDGFVMSDLTVNALDAHPNALANQLAADRVLRCLAKAVSRGDAKAPMVDRLGPGERGAGHRPAVDR